MKRRGGDSVETPVASLIDVVFLLIIFFVVTAAVEKDVVDDTIRLAQAKHAAAAETRNPRTVIINVRADGTANIAKQPFSDRQLEQLLIGLRKSIGEDVPILIRADGNTRYEHVSRINDIITESGFYKTQLAAESTKR